jgi:hypothetical protein
MFFIRFSAFAAVSGGIEAETGTSIFCFMPGGVIVSVMNFSRIFLVES